MPKKKKKSKKGIVKFLLLIIFISLLAVIIGKVDYFKIDNIEIKGNKMVSVEEINALVSIKGMNIIYLNKGFIREKICTNPYVEAVNIKRKLPSKVIINIREKQVKGLIKFQNGFINIDSEGRMIKIVDKFPNESLPLITGVDVKQYIPNEYIAKIDEIQKNSLKEVLKFSNFKEYNNIIISIDVKDSYNIIFKTKYGIDINIGSCENLEDKLTYGFTVLNSPEIKGKKGCIKIYSVGEAIFSSY